MPVVYREWRLDTDFHRAEKNGLPVAISYATNPQDESGARYKSKDIGYGDFVEVIQEGAVGACVRPITSSNVATANKTARIVFQRTTEDSDDAEKTTIMTGSFSFKTQRYSKSVQFSIGDPVVVNVDANGKTMIDKVSSVVGVTHYIGVVEQAPTAHDSFIYINVSAQQQKV